jgi:hypothetical protein
MLAGHALIGNGKALKAPQIARARQAPRLARARQAPRLARARQAPQLVALLADHDAGPDVATHAFGGSGPSAPARPGGPEGHRRAYVSWRRDER